MRNEIIGLLFWFLFALYIAVESYRLDLGRFNEPGAGYFPFGAAALLALISLSLLVKTLRKRKLNKTELAVPGERLNWQDLIVTFLCMLAYIWFFNSLGFVLCTFVLMFILILVVGRSTLPISLVAAFLITAASYLLFETLLDADFPRGFLEAFF